MANIGINLSSFHCVNDLKIMYSLLKDPFGCLGSWFKVTVVCDDDPKKQYDVASRHGVNFFRPKKIIKHPKNS